MARLGRVGGRQAGAAAAALAAGLLAGCASHAPAAVTAASSPASVSAAPQDPLAACAKPSTSFARFWFLSMEPSPGVYQGTVRVGSVRVPAESLYVSGGAPGTGTLCVSDQTHAPDPIQATAAPRPGPIAYVGAAGSPRDTVYFATRPGVAKVTMTGAGSKVANSYTLDGPPECVVFAAECRLEPLGHGWHAIGTGFGLGTAAATLRAYDSGGHLLETLTEPLAGAAPSQPAAVSGSPARS